MVTQNATGLQADGAQAVIHVVGSTIIHNGTGLSAVNGGGLVSFGTNVVVAPVTANGAFTATTTLK